MTTFIYHNKKLHADRRKLSQIPGLTTMTALDETKVHDFGWCYFAMSGEEPKQREIENALRFASVDAGLQALCKAINAFVDLSREKKDKSYGKIRKKAGKYKDTLLTLASVISEAASDFYTADAAAGGFVMTRNNCWLIGNRFMKDYTNVGAGQSGVTGAGMGLADALVTMGVPIQEIYEHLADSGVPTGDTCETYLQESLPDLAPPLCHATFTGVVLYLLDMYFTTNVKLTAAKYFSKDELIDLLMFIRSIPAADRQEHEMKFDLEVMRALLTDSFDLFEDFDRVKNIMASKITFYKEDKKA